MCYAVLARGCLFIYLSIVALTIWVRVDFIDGQATEYPWPCCSRWLLVLPNMLWLRPGCIEEKNGLGALGFLVYITGSRWAVCSFVAGWWGRWAIDA